MKRWLFSVFAVLFIGLTCKAQDPQTLDRLSVPGPIRIANTDFVLVWSAQPNAFYFKHEYLPATEKFKSYNRLLLLEVMVADMDAHDAVQLKIDELTQRKEWDPVVNYKNYAKDNETVIDFIVGQAAADKTHFEFIERNVYRYVPMQLNGKNAIVLFGISERGYPHNMDAFIAYLKTDMQQLLDEIIQFQLPNIQLIEK